MAERRSTLASKAGLRVPKCQGLSPSGCGERQVQGVLSPEEALLGLIPAHPPGPAVNSRPPDGTGSGQRGRTGMEARSLYFKAVTLMFCNDHYKSILCTSLINDSAPCPISWFL